MRVVRKLIRTISGVATPLLAEAATFKTLKGSCDRNKYETTRSADLALNVGFLRYTQVALGVGEGFED